MRKSARQVNRSSPEMITIKIDLTNAFDHAPCIPGTDTPRWTQAIAEQRATLAENVHKQVRQSNLQRTDLAAMLADLYFDLGVHHALRDGPLANVGGY